MSNHLSICMSWGILETSPWPTLGAWVLQGSQRQMGENPARLFPGGVRAALTSMGMGSPAKVGCRDFPQGPQPIPHRGSYCEKISKQLQMAMCACVHACVCLSEKRPALHLAYIVEHVEFKISQTEDSKQSEAGISAHACVTRCTPFIPPGFTCLSRTLEWL